jgi:putative phosphoribosyl transferase
MNGDCLPITAFADRHDAGRKLAVRLTDYVNVPHLVVVALPRGGVPVGYEVSRALHASFDVFVVRKVGAPGHPELAVGAIASGGFVSRNESIIRQIGISEEGMNQLIYAERQELERREAVYRAGREPLRLENRTVILVDDGLATGASMDVAIRAVRAQSPARIVVAVPVAPLDTLERLSSQVEDIVSVSVPDSFHSVGTWYRDFTQVPDTVVRDLTRASHEPLAESFR